MMMIVLNVHCHQIKRYSYTPPMSRQHDCEEEQQQVAETTPTQGLRIILPHRYRIFKTNAIDLSTASAYIFPASSREAARPFPGAQATLRMGDLCPCIRNSGAPSRAHMSHASTSPSMPAPSSRLSPGSKAKDRMAARLPCFDCTKAPLAMSHTHTRRSRPQLTRRCPPSASVPLTARRSWTISVCLRKTPSRTERKQKKKKQRRGRVSQEGAGREWDYTILYEASSVPCAWALEKGYMHVR